MYDINMMNAFTALGKKGLAMHHYDLSEKTSIKDPIRWKNFLMDPDVNEYIKSELKIIQGSELNKILEDISSSHSVGQAQIISALSKKMEETEGKKEGPAFVYCSIPLNEQQEHAENIIRLEKDPFLK